MSRPNYPHNQQRPRWAADGLNLPALQDSRGRIGHHPRPLQRCDGTGQEWGQRGGTRACPACGMRWFPPLPLPAGQVRWHPPRVP